MQATDEHLTETVDAIMRYLDSHPDAADTEEGIAQWWLPNALSGDICTVQLALTRLERLGRVHRRLTTDQHELFSR